MMAEERTLQATLAKPVVKEARIIQLIVFRLGDEEFAAEIGQVREIVKTGAITPIPDSPEFIKGVTNVRGEIVAALDLKARFSLPRETPVPSKHIVITQQEQNLFGLLVDEVTEVLRVPEPEIKPPPEVVTRIHEPYVSGVVTVSNRLIILLDLAKVLSEEELLRVTELQRQHRLAEEKQEEKSARETATAGSETPGTPVQPRARRRKSR